MKKIISLLLCVTMILSVFSISVNGAETDLAKTSVSIKNAIDNYEKNTGETVNTKRYYFLMPDGSSGLRGTIEDYMYDEYAPSWYNDNANSAGIYWWDTQKIDPDVWPGYKMSKADSDDVYYADVPDFVEVLIFNNYFDGGMDINDPVYYDGHQTNNLYTGGYDVDESDIYPQGLPGFEDMIFVIEPGKSSLSGELTHKTISEGEWYYYYNNGCFGTVKDGDTRNCIRDDHDHENLYINFDPSDAGWGEYEKVYCVIQRLGGSPFYTPQTVRTLCTDYDGDGIYTYDLNKSEINLKDYVVYYVYFMTDTGKRTRELVMQTTNIKGTIYATGELADTYSGSKLKWKEEHKLAIPDFDDTIREYEKENGVEVQTYRNYFYIPDGSDKFKDANGLTLPNWFNEYYTDICITYMKDYSGGFPYPYPKYPVGYSINKGSADNIYYADIPVNVSQYIIGNGVVEYSAPTYSICESFLLGPECNSYYGDGLTDCDNMIFVFNEMDWYSSTTTAMCGGEWYYYYGGTCYGTVQNGSTNDCIRHDHFDENGNHLTQDIVVGDVDGDGALSIMDATEIQLVIAKLKNWLSDNAKALADVDNDGGISVLDATAIQLKLAQLSE